MTQHKSTEIVYVCRTVKSFGDDNWHGPMAYAAAKKSGLLDSSNGTVSVRTYSEDEYARIVEMNPGKTFA